MPSADLLASIDSALPRASKALSNLSERLDRWMSEYDKWLEVEDGDPSLIPPLVAPYLNHTIYMPQFKKVEISCIELVQNLPSKVLESKNSGLIAALAPKLQEATRIYQLEPELVGFFWPDRARKVDCGWFFVGG